MKNLTIILFLFASLLTYGQQEKRLALVIGNANYDKGALKNPVKDALLIARTLDSLNFDVILDTNVETKKAFFSKIKEFGNKRPNYDVAFVYYAGHGVQINNQNYLLPTKEDFSSEDDVEQMGGISVQLIIKYLTAMTDQVNVLILDACRDNPFESNWDATRSLKGSGLAKMQAPSGSMIAFSTTAGNTAPDGNGENSVYCKVLAKNMLLEGVNLDQVFRNTRAEVLKESKGRQRTEESTQLTGETFYLVQNTFTDELKQIDALIKEENYTEALVLAGHIVELSPKNKIAHYKKARVYYFLEKYENSLASLDKAFVLDSIYVSAFCLRGNIYEEQKKYDLAIKEYERGIEFKEIDPEGAAYCYSNRAEQYERLREFDKALADHDSAIELEPENAYNYYYRAWLYYEQKEYNQSIVDFTRATELDPDDADNWRMLGYVYHLGIKDYEKALGCYEKSLEVDSANVNSINSKAKIYVEQKKYDLAIKEFERGIALKEIDPEGAAYCYRNRAEQYERLREFDKALADYDSAIELEPENAINYTTRAWFYYEQKKYNMSIVDYTRATELDSDDHRFWRMLGYVYHLGIKDYEKALGYYEKSLEIDSTYVRSINSKALIYVEQKKYDLAIKEYSKGILLKEIDSKGAGYCYRNRAEQYKRLREFDKALADYDSAVALEPEKAIRYYNRADFYENILKDNKNALADFNKCVEFNPERFLIQRAKFYYRQKDFKNSKKDYSLLVDLDENNPISYNERGLFLGLIGEYDKAHQDFKKSISLDTNSTTVYFYRSKTYEKQGLSEKQKADLSKTIQMDPKDPEGYYYLAILYEKQERYYKVISNYISAIRCLERDGGYYITDDNGDRTSDFKIYLKVAETFKKIDEPEDMCEYYQKALNAAEDLQVKEEIEALIKANCN